MVLGVGVGDAEVGVGEVGEAGVGGLGGWWGWPGEAHVAQVDPRGEE